MELCIHEVSESDSGDSTSSAGRTMSSVLISSISILTLGPPRELRAVILRTLVFADTFDALGHRPSLSSHSPQRGPTGKQTT